MSACGKNDRQWWKVEGQTKRMEWQTDDGARNWHKRMMTKHKLLSHAEQMVDMWQHVLHSKTHDAHDRHMGESWGKLLIPVTCSFPESTNCFSHGSLFSQDSPMCLSCASWVLLCSTCCHMSTVHPAWLRSLCFVIILLCQFLVPSSVCHSILLVCPSTCCHCLSFFSHAIMQHAFFFFFWFILSGLHNDALSHDLTSSPKKILRFNGLISLVRNFLSFLHLLFNRLHSSWCNNKWFSFF